ncbi:MAG TPA: single-stranded-DNA-specific exonuclease RecJ [bacterium]|nr:single-stranded-DNA-specific exonuclease RecJ [bacterium]HQG46665.1 single-stranded-DNA-specific exonuclease RecJ [bacterium]HQI48582.1 single-stranded-DNA-specific exonuclease RecJ [bacterium]HQJ64038.1 single-stranded-DNA-specific exonuclease RecJ [bacterium]
MQLRWDILNQVSTEEISKLSQSLRIPPIIARMLLCRGISGSTAAQRFFEPSLDLLYDPFLLHDMQRAVDRLRKAILSDEKILIYGDYDVDGITSVSFLYLILKELGAEVSYYIPDRQSEGYGLSINGIEEARQFGTNLIITVDCGITGHVEIDAAHALGIDVIVCDHHEPGETLPNAYAVIDPKLENSTYPFRELAGVGVTYKLCQGLLLRMEIDLSILENYLELVAIGTAADIVPLVDENRVFVKEGIERLNESENIGIRALLQVAGLGGKEISTGHIVFIIAPRINAVGRMGDAQRAVKLLTTADPDEAMEIANILEQENRHRKNVDEETYSQALTIAEEQYAQGSARSLILHQRGWHPGVIGIVASRVVERFYRPTVLISVDNGVGKGSARSIEGFDLHDALKQCEDLLIGFGGHKYAAGLSIAEEQIPAFHERFEKVAASRLQAEQLIPKLTIDAELRLYEIDALFLKLLRMFAPFGPLNTRPVFMSRNLQVFGTPTIVGGNHLKFKVRDGGAAFEVIGFNMGGMLSRIQQTERALDLVYVIEENEYNGRKTIQLRAKDLR